MNILLVDDNKNNRMILRLLLEDYMEDHSDVEFVMDDASDGVEAVSMCDAKEYAIVLMDIMMPNMDGIEATKRIRQKHKKLMIIAVSAVDDMERQKQILSNGAEDYISKPVNSDIFTTRINNYVSLIHARGSKHTHKREQTQGYNLFSKDIFSRHIKFMLTTEDALSELWEYYLLDGEGKCEYLSDVIRTIFSIAEAQHRLSVQSDLYVEESESFNYFTITKVDELPSIVLKLLLKKNEVKCEYKIEADRLTFKLVKNSVETSSLLSETADIVDREFIPETQEVTSSSIAYTSQELSVFHYLEEEDMADLEEYAGRLSSLMLIVGNGDVEEEEAIEIYTYIEKLGAILSTYSEVYPISIALSNLASDMSTHVQEFIANAEALGPMCAAFSKDLSNWIEQSFHTGAPSVDFMNDTISVNCQTIAGMLKMDEAPADGADDFDDIFDF
jgi:two-component system chemotaxis response regulator CheY